jgi:hypothetical protein
MRIYMTVKKSNRLSLGIGGGVVFVLALLLALTLLVTGKLSGGEFTAFVLAFAVIALAVGFAPEVQELSIAGNILKLKEVKAEAIIAIESLNNSRVETFRFLIPLTIEPSGMFAYEGSVDPRVDAFRRVYLAARETGRLAELKPELLFATKVLLNVQLSLITHRNRSALVRDLGATPDPLDLAAVAFDKDGVAEAVAARSPTPENYPGEIKEALVAYSQVFELRRDFEKLPDLVLTGQRQS